MPKAQTYSPFTCWLQWCEQLCSTTPSPTWWTEAVSQNKSFLHLVILDILLQQQQTSALFIPLTSTIAFNPTDNAPLLETFLVFLACQQPGYPTTLMTTLSWMLSLVSLPSLPKSEQPPRQGPRLGPLLARFIASPLFRGLPICLCTPDLWPKP
jgi:hypothetical protein